MNPKPNRYHPHGSRESRRSCQPRSQTSWLMIVAFLFSVSTISAHYVAKRKIPGSGRPVCTQGSICFSGEVSADQPFRHPLTSDIDFVLEPGWTIAIEPKKPEGHCNEFASVVNAPYRAHRALYINAWYEWTAEDEVSNSPREFRFVTNCADYRAESERLDIVLWPNNATNEKYNEAQAKLGTSPLGKGRLWITDSKVTHAEDTADNKKGKIQGMKFTVEITLPRRSEPRP